METERAATPRSGAFVLDHVALWTDCREAIADLVCDGLGMHVIDQTEAFTLVGADARKGKLTLFAAEGPREPGVLERVVLRVGDLEAAVGRLPADTEVTREDGEARIQGPGGLRLGLVERRDCPLDYDLDSVVLRVPSPPQAATALAGLGFEPDGGDGRLRAGDKDLVLVEGTVTEGPPLLNHIALLVESVDTCLEQARARGVEIADVKEGPNTRAVFVWGPDRVQIEYVEHKPGFALV